MTDYTPTPMSPELQKEFDEFIAETRGLLGHKQEFLMWRLNNQIGNLIDKIEQLNPEIKSKSNT